MNVILTATWNPRGEEFRFATLLPRLLRLYSHVVLVLPPDTDPEIVDDIQTILQKANAVSIVQVILSLEWPMGRFLALQLSLELPGDFIHYADFDRLLRWIERMPDELDQVVGEIQNWDCLVIGRDQAAYATHPQALLQTEAMSNLVASAFFGESADFSAGSKGFSRRAVEYLVTHADRGYPFGADAEWPILLKRVGFRIHVVFVRGLDWESADRYQEQAADEMSQRQAAKAYDADPSHWAYRVKVAQEIAQSAIRAARKPLVLTEGPAFDFDSVFDVDDYLYFYEDMLTSEKTLQQVEFLVEKLDLNPSLSILDLACGFGRHANLLAKIDMKVTGIDFSAGFLEIARKNAKEFGVEVDYRQGDMRSLDIPAGFDRVLLLFTAFGYFEDAENLLVLRNIARALKPGGLLVFDIHNRDGFTKDLIPFIVTEKDSNLMIDRSTFDSLTGRLYNRRIVIRDGIRRDKPFFVRMFNPNEIHDLLAQAGFLIDKLYGGWDGTPFTSESRRMVIIARKTELLEKKDE